VIAGTVVKETRMRRDQTSAQIGQELGLAAATVQKYARDRRIPCDLTSGGHVVRHADGTTRLPRARDHFGRVAGRSVSIMSSRMVVNDVPPCV